MFFVAGQPRADGVFDHGLVQRQQMWVVDLTLGDDGLDIAMSIGMEATAEEDPKRS